MDKFRIPTLSSIPKVNKTTLCRDCRATGRHSFKMRLRNCVKSGTSSTRVKLSKVSETARANLSTQAAMSTKAPTRTVSAQAQAFANSARLVPSTRASGAMTSRLVTAFSSRCRTRLLRPDLMGTKSLMAKSRSSCRMANSTKAI